MIRFIEFIIRYCEFGGRKAKYILNKAKRTQKETQNETKKEPLRYTKSLEFSKEKYSLR